MVSPPPGVSSAVSVPPIASVKPLATARPSPTPVACGDVVEALEGLEHPDDAFCGDSLAVVDDAQFSRGAAVQGCVAEAACSSDEDDVGVGRVFDGVLHDVRDDAFEHSGVGVDFGHVSRQLHPHPACRGSVEGGRNHFVPAHRFDERVDGIGRDPGHVQQVAHQRVQPVGAFVDGGEQVLLLLGGVMDVGLLEASDGKLDAGQGRAEVVGDRTENGGAHSVAFG